MVYTKDPKNGFTTGHNHEQNVCLMTELILCHKHNSPPVPDLERT